MKYFWLFNLLCGVLLSMASPPNASGKNTVLDLGPDQICSNPVPKDVAFSLERNRYKFTGTCDLVRTRLQIPVKVPYTAVGTYDPKTGETNEGIDVPAPAINEPSRPYGKFKSRMRCNMDPWLNTRLFKPSYEIDQNVQCDQRQFSADPPWTAYGPGPVGDYMKSLIYEFSRYAIGRPHSVWMEEDQRKTLNVHHR